MNRNLIRKTVSSLFLSLGVVSISHANIFPEKPIRIIVPFAAGGSTDIMARMTADAISKKLNQTVIVENKAGASGNIGMDAVAKSPADGYTLLFTSTNLTLNPYVVEQTPYDPIKDFDGVTMLAFAPMVLIARPDFAGDTFDSFVKHSKENQHKLNFSSSGAGGVPHLAGEMLKRKLGIEMTHVPYNGAAPAITDIVGGQVEMTFTTYVSAGPMLSANKLKAVAVANNSRLESLPNTPTFNEVGIDDFEFGTMFGLLAPKNTPEQIREVIYEAVKSAADDKTFQEKITNLGSSMVLNTPSEYNQYLLNDVKKWAELIKGIDGLSKN